MRKAEMEAHHDAYVEKEGDIRAMLADRQFPAVFDVCRAAFPDIVPAIQYRRREDIEPQTPMFLSFEVICKYAPPLFEHGVLDALLEFVSSTRILARAETGYLQMVEAAVERDEIARQFWNHLERQPGTLQRDVARILGHDEKAIDETAEVWEHLRLITRGPTDDSHRLSLRSCLDVEVEGLCHACGVRGRGRKESFLKPVRCQRCGAEGFYHIKYTDVE